MEDHLLLYTVLCKWGGAQLIVVWARKPQILLIMKKGYSQVDVKDFNMDVGMSD